VLLKSFTPMNFEPMDFGRLEFFFRLLDALASYLGFIK